MILRTTINERRLTKRFVTTAKVLSYPSNYGTPGIVDISVLQLDPSMFEDDASHRLCIVLDFEPLQRYRKCGGTPPITIVLITSFDGKPLNEVLAQNDMERLMHVYPALCQSGMAESLRITPPLPFNYSQPMYVLCVPIMVYPEFVHNTDTICELDPSNLAKLRSRISSLGDMRVLVDPSLDEEEEPFFLDYRAYSLAELDW